MNENLKKYIDFCLEKGLEKKRNKRKITSKWMERVGDRGIFYGII